MAIASFKPTVPGNVEINPPKIEPDKYESIVADDKYTPLNSLIAYVSGAPWTVDYFSQIVTADSGVRGHDQNQLGVYQQYTRIKDLELRVSNALNSSQDTDSGAMSVVGSALIYPFLTPNVGDMFIASIQGGNQGLFQITNIERRTFNKDAVFAVDYALMCYLNQDPNRVKDLESKVNRELYFNKDRLIEGGNPTLAPTEHKQVLDLTNAYKSLCRHYFKTFFNREYSTLILPGQLISVYDSFLVKYLLKITDTFDAYEVRYVKNVNTEHEVYLQQPQFWQVLLDRDIDLLNFVNREMGCLSTSVFSYMPQLGNLRLTGIDYIVYPILPDTSVLKSVAPHSPDVLFSSLDSTVSPQGNISGLIRDTYIDQNRSIPYIYNVNVDTNYVFSKEFYEGTNQQSLLESLTRDYIQFKALSIDRLHELTLSSSRWGRLEQFYYIPVLLTLIKTAIRGVY